MKTVTIAMATVLAVLLGGSELLGALRAGVGEVSGSAVWAMLIAGFGAVGAVVRKGRTERTYRLVEEAPEGAVLEEEFAAPDDASALSRASSVADGRFQLWRGDILVRG